MTLVLASDHGHEGGVVVGELSVVGVEGGDFAKGKPLSLWATAATSEDAVPLMKAL
jgi:hypothetical protein